MAHLKQTIVVFLWTTGCLCLTTPGLAATLVITSSGYWQLTVDAAGIPKLTPFDEVIRMGEHDPPTPGPGPPTPDPGPLTLTAKVNAWATEVDEPQVSEAQGFIIDVIARQGEKGVFGTKSEMTEFTKLAIPRTLSASGSAKQAEWQDVWDAKIWPAVRRLEGTGQMDTINDQVKVWEEIAAGFKQASDSQWSLFLKKGTDGKTYMAIVGEASPLLTILLQLILELLVEWLKDRGNLET